MDKHNKISKDSLDSIKDSSGQGIFRSSEVLWSVLYCGEECLCLVIFSKQPVSNDSQQ